MYSDRFHKNTGTKKFKSIFTLIEMLVVIAILAILAMLLLPALQSALNTSRQVLCANNERQIGVIVSSYTNDYHGYFPLDYSNYISNGGRQYSKQAATGTSLPPIDQQFPSRYLVPLLRGYMGNTNVNGTTIAEEYACPSAPESADMSNFISASNPDNLLKRAHYMFNMYIFGTKNNRSRYNSYTKNYLLSSQRESQIYAPAEAHAFADCMSNSASARYTQPPTLTNECTSYTQHNSPHENRVNILYIDGHAEAMSRIPIVGTKSEITQFRVFSTSPPGKTPGMLFWNRLGNQLM